MADILQKIRINADGERVYTCLATTDGLAGWWTSTTTGDAAPGSTLNFRFGEHVLHMRVLELEPPKRVAWECTGPDPEWIGTRLTFELSDEDGRTTLRFGHRDWQQGSDLFAHCSMKWATFLLSLRDLAETGKGRPFPQDIAV